MATEKEYQSLYDRIAALREQMVNRLSADLIQNPQLADALMKQIDDMLLSAEKSGYVRSFCQPDHALLA